MLITLGPREKKRRLIASVIRAYAARDPEYLKECAAVLSYMRANEYDRTGKLKAEANGTLDHGGYVQVRVPQHLFLVLRKFDPTFGNNDEDLVLLSEEFPDLCHHKATEMRPL